MGKKTVLFLCTHNSARSQIAEGFLNSIFKDDYEAFSAGILPTQVSPYAIEVMNQVGIDLSKHRSKSIEEYKDKTFDYVVTVCNKAKESCPFFPGKKIIHKDFSDPSSADGSQKEIIEEFQKIRDEIKLWIEKEFHSK